MVGLMVLGVSLRAGLYAHTTQALSAGPVSAAIPNAELRRPFRASLTHPDYASLVDPLFRFAEKRVSAICFFNTTSARCA